MKQDKYAKGWFRLADLLDNKDKKYALALYRLLAVTIEDDAYACQLEADILWFFNDPQALQKYEQAAQQYQDNNNLRAALGVYEQLLDLDNNPDYSKRRDELISLVRESQDTFGT